MRYPNALTAQASADGRELLFTSARNITGYESGVGAQEAYLYSAESETTTCVSCRLDGQHSVGSQFTFPIRATWSFPQELQGPPRSLSADGSRVFFQMPDALATGAVEGKENLYEWRQGVVYWLGTFSGAKAYGFLDASANGDDVFINTEQQLDPHDTDFVLDAYDIRVGGGFPPPTPAPVPCDPAADQCRPAPTPQPAGVGSGGSAAVSGPGNPPAPRPCPKLKVRRNGKCVPKHRRHKAAHRRHAKRAAGQTRGGQR
jgi:hypothetical protein